MKYQFTVRRMFWWVYALAVAAVTGTIVADVWVDLDYKLLANIALLAMAVLVIAFALLYGTRSAWWTNRIGRIYLVKSVVLACVLAQIVLAIWWDEEFPGRQHLRFAIYALGAAVYVPMLVSLWLEQRRDRRERSAEGCESIT